MLDYRIRAYWNGTQVLEASASATMAADVASAFLRDQFAGQWATQEIARQCNGLLERVLDGQRVGLDFSDATGAASVTIWRHYETAAQVSAA